MFETRMRLFITAIVTMTLFLAVTSVHGLDKTCSDESLVLLEHYIDTAEAAVVLINEDIDRLQNAVINQDDLFDNYWLSIINGTHLTTEMERLDCSEVTNFALVAIDYYDNSAIMFSIGIVQYMYPSEFTLNEDLHLILWVGTPFKYKVAYHKLRNYLHEYSLSRDVGT